MESTTDLQFDEMDSRDAAFRRQWLAAFGTLLSCTVVATIIIGPDVSRTYGPFVTGLVVAGTVPALVVARRLAYLLLPIVLVVDAVGLVWTMHATGTAFLPTSAALERVAPGMTTLCSDYLFPASDIPSIGASACNASVETAALVLLGAFPGWTAGIYLLGAAAFDRLFGR